MNYPKRKQMRLSDYDYSQNGYYYITVCTYNRNKLFGKLQNGEIYLSEYGKIADFVWNDLINHNPIVLHEYIIMPDHIHGIIQINNNSKSVEISEIIRQFKTFSSKRINEHLKRNGLEPFPTGKLWQKSFYDHIIRDENDYIIKSQYIINNPIDEREMYK